MKTNTYYAENNDISKLILNHLEYATQDFQKWLDLLDDQIIIEFPFGEAAGNPSSMEGKELIEKSIKEFLDSVPGIRFKNPVIYLGADPDEAFAKYEVEVDVPATGKVYKQKYIAHFRQQKGKLIYLSEYFDPTKVLEAFNK